MSRESFAAFAYWPRRGQLFLLALTLIAMLCAARGGPISCGPQMQLTRIAGAGAVESPAVD